MLVGCCDVADANPVPTGRRIWLQYLPVAYRGRTHEFVANLGDFRIWTVRRNHTGYDEGSAGDFNGMVIYRLLFVSSVPIPAAMSRTVVVQIYIAAGQVGER